MNLSDLIFVLLLVTFLPFNEGIISKSPLWKKLADSIELGTLKSFTWRANANITSELHVLTKYFKRMAVMSGVAFVLTFYLIQSHQLTVWTSSVFFFSFLAWFSFKWTFQHREALQPFTNTVGFSLIGPWILLLLDRTSPELKIMQSFSKLFIFLPFQPETSLSIAATLFLLLIIFIVFYYILGWIILSPFAYFVLASLKISRTISVFLIKKFNRNILNDICVTIQIFGFIAVYFLGRNT